MEVRNVHGIIYTIISKNYFDLPFFALRIHIVFPLGFVMLFCMSGFWYSSRFKTTTM